MDFNGTPKNKKPMNGDEVSRFIELLILNPLILSKETNAATNILKEKAWDSVTAAYNACLGGIPRQKSQLKLKWDNLKRAARKRSQRIRMNTFKTGGGKPDFIPPDEALDKVIGILGATCTGFEVPFGGDAVIGSTTTLIEVVASDNELNIIDSNNATVELPDNDITPNISEVKKRKIDFSTVEEGSNDTYKSTKGLYGMSTMSKPLKNKVKRKTNEDSREKKNLAIANYYNKKTEILSIEAELLKIKLAKEKESNEEVMIVPT